MVNQVKNGLDQKQKASIFGIIKRNVYTKEELKSATKLSDYMPLETAQDYQVRAEQEKARATEFVLRRAAITQ